MDTSPNQFKPAQLVPVGNDPPVPIDVPPKEPDLKDKARAHTDAALQVLTDIMVDDFAPKTARIQAASIVLERGWGKAKQEIETTTMVTYQDLLKQIRNNENKFIEVDYQDVTPVPPAIPSWDDLI